MLTATMRPPLPATDLQPSVASLINACEAVERPDARYTSIAMITYL